MRGYMVNNQLLYYDKLLYMSIKILKKIRNLLNKCSNKNHF